MPASLPSKWHAFLSAASAGLTKQLHTEGPHSSAATAVAAVAGRYPGSAPDAGAEGFWQVLKDEKDLPTAVPLQRWDVDEYFSPAGKGRQLSMYVRMASFIEDLDLFDAGLFRYHTPIMLLCLGISLLHNESLASQK